MTPHFKRQIVCGRSQRINNRQQKKIAQALKEKNMYKHIVRLL
ncbi:hypothetical protein ACEQPO_03220 [Bacillus sp. SL00103]